MNDDYWKEYDAIVEEAVVLTIIAILDYYISSHVNKSPKGIASLSGEAYIEELLTTSHSQRIHDVFRMLIHTLFDLTTWLLNNTALKSSRKVSVTEKLAMFIAITGHSHSF